MGIRRSQRPQRRSQRRHRLREATHHAVLPGPPRRVQGQPVHHRSSHLQTPQPRRRSATHLPAVIAARHRRLQRMVRPTIWNRNATPNPQLPILTGSMPLTSEAPLYISIQHTTPQEPAVNLDLAAAFAARSRQIEAIATAVVLNTPDSYMNPVGGALTIAAEGLWDPKLECVMHGCVAWRSVFAGWRGPYSLDALGHHDRAKLHFRRWLKKQNISPITTSSPATGPADPRSYLARKESLLHSNGDLSNNHYDMNMVFFDVLLRHLRWTGDLDFALEIWPAFERHLAWEQRLFRRTFTSHDGTELPLYEAYAAIWASDNLQYNGGGVTHSSAYNLFAFRTAATLARMLNKDPSPYEHEAALIHHAMQEFLWLPHTRLLRRVQRSPRPADRLQQPRRLDHVPRHRQRGPRQTASLADGRRASRRTPPHSSQRPRRARWRMVSPRLLRLAPLYLVAHPHRPRGEHPHRTRHVASRHGRRRLPPPQGQRARLHVSGPVPRQLPHVLAA